MAIFGPKPWVNPFRKMLIIRLFELLVFIPWKFIFSFQNIVTNIFLVYIAQKKKLEKWSFFDQKHGLTPLKKCQFFDSLNFLFLQPRKAFFRSRISLQTFSCSILPKKKRVGKMAIFGHKPSVYPFRKMSIFGLFELLLFIAQKGIFFALKYHKGHFPALYCIKKQVGKMAIFGPKPWVNPFRKMSIFRLFELLVFIPQKCIFSFQNILTNIFLVDIA